MNIPIQSQFIISIYPIFVGSLWLSPLFTGSASDLFKKPWHNGIDPCSTANSARGRSGNILLPILTTCRGWDGSQMVTDRKATLWMIGRCNKQIFIERLECFWGVESMIFGTRTSEGNKEGWEGTGLECNLCGSSAVVMSVCGGPCWQVWQKGLNMHPLETNPEHVL